MCSLRRDARHRDDSRGDGALDDLDAAAAMRLIVVRTGPQELLHLVEDDHVAADDDGARQMVTHDGEDDNELRILRRYQIAEVQARVQDAVVDRRVQRDSEHRHPESKKPSSILEFSTWNVFAGFF